MKPPHTSIVAILLISLAHLAAGCASTNRAGVPADIPIIDTHIHLYDTARPQGVPWPPKTDKVLYRPVLAKDFDKICLENGIDATVIVEASDIPSDNQWVLDETKHNPRRFIALVGQLPFGTDEFAPLLEKYTKDKRFVGLRLRARPGGDKF